MQKSHVDVRQLLASSPGMDSLSMQQLAGVPQVVYDVYEALPEPRRAAPQPPAETWYPLAYWWDSWDTACAACRSLGHFQVRVSGVAFFCGGSQLSPPVLCMMVHRDEGQCMRTNGSLLGMSSSGYGPQHPHAGRGLGSQSAQLEAAQASSQGSANARGLDLLSRELSLFGLEAYSQFGQGKRLHWGRRA
eukprot:Polyplicarium_translucidae@DN3118_c0_g1_i11.p1